VADSKTDPKSFGERMAMVHQLTLEALGIGELPRLRRDVVKTSKRAVKKP